MTFEEGVDTILAVFKAVWGTRKAVYDNLPGSPPPADVIWARPTVKFATGGQGSLTSGTGTVMQDAKGILWIQVFAAVGDGNVNGLRAAQELVDAYSDYSGGVWFRNVRLESGNSEGAFQRFDVKANFEFTNAR